MPAASSASAVGERLGQELVGEPERGGRVGAAAAEARRRPGSPSRSPRCHRRSLPPRPRAPERRRRRSCRRRNRRHEGVPRARCAIRSASAMRCRTVATSCLPSSRSGPTTRARLIFAGATASLIRAPAVSSTNTLRRERLRADGRVEPERGERGDGLLARRNTRELQRVGQRLAPVRKRASTTRRTSAKRSGSGDPPERDDRGVDVRRRAEDGARHGMEGSAPRGELDEHGDRAVRLRRRRREEAVRDLALHHDAPEVDRRETGEALGDDRRGDVVGQVGDELRRGRIEAREVEPECVTPVQRHVLPRCEVREVRLEPAVELDGVDVGAALGEEPGEDAEARPDLEHDVVGVELGQPGDDAEDVVVDEEVLAERLLRCDAHGAGEAEGRVGVPVDLRARAPRAPSPRTSASAASVWRTFAGSLRLPRRGWGARYGLSVSARILSAGTAAAALPEVDRLRVRDVAGEGDVVPAARAAVSSRSGAEKQWRTTVPANGCERGCRVRVGVARVDRRPAARPTPPARAGARRARAALARREVVEVVEAGLPHGDDLRVPDAARRARRSARLRRLPAWCGSMPTAAKTPSCCSAIASAARHDAMPVPIVITRETPTARARSTRTAAGSSQRVEVRVGVDHGAEPELTRPGARAAGTAARRPRFPPSRPTSP